MREIAAPLLRCAHGRFAAYTARVCGYAFRSLDGDDGYLFEVRDGTRRAVFSAGAGSPYAFNEVRAASLARDKAFCATVLRQAGLPALAGEMFFITKKWLEMRGPGREPEDALRYAANAAYPVFCKPLAASNGVFAEVITDADAFGAYMRRAAREHFAILIQPFVRGHEYRIFVLDGKTLFSYRKLPPQVVGDGRTSLRELAARSGRLDGAPPHSPRARDQAKVLFAADDIPAANQILTLEGAANRAAGGGATDLRDGAPAALARLALAAIEALGLRLAAVDIFDVSPAADLSDLCIIEVNSNPMIATLEDHDRWDLIAEIWRANFAAALR